MRVLLLVFLAICLTNCKTKLSTCKNSYDNSYNGSVKVGAPYKVKNITYSPELDASYNEIGQASWYGGGFHCEKTANGEYFNKHQFSAAHRTLPMPSVAKVTNLANGKSVKVIINDRGPFIKGRIIDLSESAAAEIGMKRTGVATVRVQFLPEDTNQLMEKINSSKKIFYKDKKNNSKEILIAKYHNQKEAVKTMHKTAKLGKVHLIADKNSYKVLLPVKGSLSIKNTLKKLHLMGYKNAKVTSY